MSKRTKPKAEAPKRRPLPLTATWLRQMADAAEAGQLVGLAAVVMLDGYAIPITNVADPTGTERMTLAGSVAQLHHMLQCSEHNERMASLAAAPQA